MGGFRLVSNGNGPLGLATLERITLKKKRSTKSQGFRKYSSRVIVISFFKFFLLVSGDL